MKCKWHVNVKRVSLSRILRELLSHHSDGGDDYERTWHRFKSYTEDDAAGIFPWCTEQISETNAVFYSLVLFCIVFKKNIF